MDSTFGNIDDLFLFCTVVEQGSLLAASKRLELPVSTMSRRLSALEERLNMRLLHKQGRELVATESGWRVYESFRSEMEQIEVAYQQLRRQQNDVEGTIRLSCPHSFYSGFVAQIVEQLLKQHPKLNIELQLNQESGMLPATERDLIMTFDISNMDDMIARPLFTSRHGFYASKEYIARHGMPSTLTELERCQWLCVDQDRKINLYRDDKLAHVINIKPRLILNEIHQLMAVVERGVGVASIPQNMVKGTDLVPLMPEYSRSDRQAYLVYKERKYQPRALTLVVEALLNGVKNMPGPTRFTV
ncbi:LysR family transcriptional regulator [Vibrio aquaticus]|uniref:LysR family transcriptional regulator n=1 Tax=Vibrio aquaticus TaxID=2496559 RepID=UPI001AC001D7|nr:LysR family transcriptional regulator [Vibrio aquaticus]